jgi:hypothetical protein
MPVRFFEDNNLRAGFWVRKTVTREALKPIAIVRQDANPFAVQP